MSSYDVPFSRELILPPFLERKNNFLGVEGLRPRNWHAITPRGKSSGGCIVYSVGYGIEYIVYTI